MPCRAMALTLKLYEMTSLHDTKKRHASGQRIKAWPKHGKGMAENNGMAKYKGWQKNIGMVKALKGKVKYKGTALAAAAASNGTAKIKRHGSNERQEK